MAPDMLLKLNSPSPCVEEARRLGQQEKQLHSFGALRNLTFVSRHSDKEKPSYLLKDQPTEKIVGEVSCCKSKEKSDSVEGYVFTRLGTGDYLEAICRRAEPKRIDLYVNGLSTGSLQEIDVPQEQTLFRKIFCAKRGWQVFDRDALIGQIDAQYPMNHESRALFRTTSGVELHLDLGNYFCLPDWGYVIPRDAPETGAPGRELLLFQIAICFRTLIFSYDFPSSDS